MSSSLERRVVVMLLVSALVAGLLPSFAEAQRASSSRLERDGAFCENIDTARETALSRLEERKDNSDRGGRYEEKRGERLGELNTRRDAHDDGRESRYERLRAAADTDAKEAAVEDFIDTVEDLVAERRVAVDVAIDAFEETVEALLAEREEAVSDYASSIEDSINEIFDDAEAACEDDEAAADIRTQLREDLATMREDIKADREQYSFKDELEEARAVRRAAIEEAVDTFKAAYEAAKEDLKAALGV